MYLDSCGNSCRDLREQGCVDNPMVATACGKRELMARKRAKEYASDGSRVVVYFVRNKLDLVHLLSLSMVSTENPATLLWKF